MNKDVYKRGINRRVCALSARLPRPPQMASELKNITVVEGQTVVLSCLAYSSEPCLTHWLRHHEVNGSYLDAHDRLNYFTQITVGRRISSH